MRGATRDSVPAQTVSGRDGVRVLVAADEPLEGRALELLLETAGFETQYVEHLARARGMLRSAVDEVVLWVGEYMDAEPIEQARAIRTAQPDVGLCALANGADPDRLRALLSERSAGFAFLLRRSRPEVGDLLDAVRRVAGGQATLEPQVLERLFKRSGPRHPGLDSLSRGEREVLERLASGLRNREIARQLYKSEKTVEKRVGQVFSKLGLDPETSVHLDRRVAATRIFLSGQSFAAHENEVVDESRSSTHRR